MIIFLFWFSLNLPFLFQSMFFTHLSSKCITIWFPHCPTWTWMISLTIVTRNVNQRRIVVIYHYIRIIAIYNTFWINEPEISPIDCFSHLLKLRIIQWFALSRCILWRCFMINTNVISQRSLKWVTWSQVTKMLFEVVKTFFEMVLTIKWYWWSSIDINNDRVSSVILF